MPRAGFEPFRVVVIGGGNGLSALLAGLKRYARLHNVSRVRELAGGIALTEITAVVTVTDDGGSSGRLRKEFAVLPPGDIRNCMAALSEDETLMARLFQYRFQNGWGLKGHSFGNLFLTALTDLTGDFARAVSLSSEVLRSLGRIYPSTSANVTLEARLANGRTVAGETKISKSRSRIERISLRPRRCKPLPQTLEALARADVITLGPGSLFTSIIPNLLVEGIPEAIAQSAALKAYFVNLMWQPGETTNFRASDHVEALYRHAGRRFLDYVIVNTRPVPRELVDRYAARKAEPVENDFDNLEKLGVRVIAADLLRKAVKVRHDPSVAAALIINLADRARRRKRRSPAGEGRLARERDRI